MNVLVRYLTLHRVENVPQELFEIGIKVLREYRGVFLDKVTEVASHAQILKILCGEVRPTGCSFATLDAGIWMGLAYDSTDLIRACEVDDN